jgi:hypothetical protein
VQHLLRKRRRLSPQYARRARQIGRGPVVREAPLSTLHLQPCERRVAAFECPIIELQVVTPRSGNCWADIEDNGGSQMVAVGGNTHRVVLRLEVSASSWAAKHHMNQRPDVVALKRAEWPNVGRSSQLGGSGLTLRGSPTDQMTVAQPSAWDATPLVSQAGVKGRS